MYNPIKKTLATILCSAALLAGCGGGKGGGGSTLPVIDITPDQFTFVDQTGVATSTEITSAAVTITGINTTTSVSVAGGSYAVNGGAFTLLPGTLNNLDTVQVRHTSGATPGAVTNTTLAVDGVTDIFTSTTTAPPGADITPDQFTFVDQTGVAVSTEITSAAITIAGIDTATTISVIGGSYAVNGGAFGFLPGSVSNGDTVQVRHTSAAANSAVTNTTLAVDGVTDTFTSTTVAGPVADTTPDQFTFVDQANVATSTVITSAAVTITGINAPANVSVSGGFYAVNGGAFTLDAGTVNSGDSVQVRHTSAAANSAVTNTTLTVDSISDVFTSTTAPAAVALNSLLPLLTGTGDLNLIDPVTVSSTNVDSGLTPPALGGCNDCSGQAEAFFTGTVTGTTVSNLRAARLAYAKPAADAGGEVFKVDLTQGAVNTPVKISSITDACRTVRTETTDPLNVDSSVVVVERAGLDASCSAAADNIASVIRLNTPAASAGTDIPLALGAGNPIHVQTDAMGVVTGYVSFEIADVNTFNLVHRDANLVADLVPLQVLEASAGADTTGANIERSDFSHLYVTAIPDNQGLTLFRVEANGTLSPVLYSFAGFNAGNPIQEGQRDASNLYFSDETQLLRIPVDSAGGDAAVITTIVHPTLGDTLRITNFRLDSSTTPGRVVFDASDNSLTVASGVFSAPVNGADVTATTLANYPDSLGGSATLVVATHGRAYINVTNHDAVPEDAVKINTDDGLGISRVTTTNAYWPGSSRADSFDLATAFTAPTESIFLSTRTIVEGLNVDNVSVVNPATGMTDISSLGSVSSVADFQSIKVLGLGRYALARAEIDRSGNLDSDTYFLDAQTANSLVPLAETAAAHDIPFGK